MPYDDDNDRSTLSTTTTSVYTPVTIDKQPLSWDGNDAGILGLLYEIGRYFKAKGLFQTLLKYRAAWRRRRRHQTGNGGGWTTTRTSRSGRTTR